MKYKLKAFWNNLRNSFYNPGFYSSIPQGKLSSGLKFVLFLTFLSIIIVTIKFFVIGIPEVRKIRHNDFVEKTYPEGLVITIKEGLVSTNVKEPYVVASESKSSMDDPENLVVIDTNPEISLNTINSYNSLAVLTYDSLVLHQAGRETRIISLSRVKDLVIDKESTQVFVDKLIKFLPLAVLIGSIFGIPIIVLFCFFASIIPLILLALIPLLVARIKGWKIGYKDAFKISLYTLGPVIVVDTLTMILGIMTMSVWVTLIIITLISVFNLRKPE
jgi:hypothetical protein